MSDVDFENPEIDHRSTKNLRIFNIWQQNSGFGRTLGHYTEVQFASFFSGGFITAIVVNPPERRLVKCTSVHYANKCNFFHK